MNVASLLRSLENCPCGRIHTVNLKAVEIGHGLKERTAEILAKNAFPRKVLVVADQNTLRAADGILDILASGGFSVKLKCYENFREPLVSFVEEIKRECADVDGILSVGTGSLNDICRRAALLCDKEFAIFATAPSMDGFASGTSPIIENGLKSTLPARQPSIIIGDTAILAASPAVLKAAGFGDIIGKYIALVDWRVAHLTVGEYYCEAIAELVRTALRRIVSLADRVTAKDEETAGAIMETLVLTGIAMKLAESSRPASGAEHMISHYWGMRKLDNGEIADFHGKKVGVATLMLCRLYHRLAAIEHPTVGRESIDWDTVYAAYGADSRPAIRKQNTPTITDDIPPEVLAARWAEIRTAICEELPSPETLEAILRRAGAATDCREIDIDPALRDAGLRYHIFMRHKVVLTRLLPMLGIDPVSFLAER